MNSKCQTSYSEAIGKITTNQFELRSCAGSTSNFAEEVPKCLQPVERTIHHNATHNRLTITQHWHHHHFARISTSHRTISSSLLHHSELMLSFLAPNISGHHQSPPVGGSQSETSRYRNPVNVRLGGFSYTAL